MEDLYIKIPKEEYILEDGTQIIIKAIVKHRGIWKINLNDADKWPSDPHGDRVDCAEKLDLLNGNIYSKITKLQIGRFSNKTMRFMFLEVKKHCNEKIFEKLISQKDCITYL